MIGTPRDTGTYCTKGSEHSATTTVLHATLRVTKIRPKNDESHRDTIILRKIYQGYVRGGYNVFSCLVATQSRAHEHSSAAAAATLSSTRATLDSSSTLTPVVAVVVLLRTARAALERTSMMSRFPSMAFCTAEIKDAGPRSLDCSSATSTRQPQARRGQPVTGTRALSSSSSAQWHSSNTRLEQHLYACCC